jgi:hypothetical protein
VVEGQNVDKGYVELCNDVLAVNYYGEVLTVELMSRLLAQRAYDKYRQILARQLLDETRHANLTRRLLLSRGRDPLRTDDPSVFTFEKQFEEFGGRGGDATLAFLAENERISSRNFDLIIRIARQNGDEEMASLYGEILNDEVAHSHNLLAALPQNDPAVLAVREEAREQMRRCLSLRYMRFVAAYPLAKRGTKP